MKRYRPVIIAAVAALVASAMHLPTAAQDLPGTLTPTPVIEQAGGRYVLMVLDQADFDLTKSRSTVNVLLDTRTGKTWVLQWGVKPNSNERGYVWSEIPFAAAPK
ncbi:hypothetical protein A8950_3767 [Dongia mobilis]|uniref:Uncharacterized protein n=1 Tax=Dongia mobilis TaxID=578943 RepID=A0A4R6WD58_9PROT|nr:hypothetical protein [Dongia mobilis]TDQ77613.1 hypothetical protein A8950_3767 [Dongia mobilis]